MKVFFTLSQAFNPSDGGVQHTTYKLGKYFTEKGLDVSYYSLAGEGHIDVQYGKLFVAPEDGFDLNPNNIADLKRALEGIRPDIVINQKPYDRNLTKALANEKENLNYVLLGCLRNSLFSVVNNLRDIVRRTVPKPLFFLLDNKVGLAFMLHLHRWKHANALREILDSHDKYILLSPPNRKELEYFVGSYKPDKVLAIPNSIPKLNDFKREDKKKIILHVGRLNISQKRSDLLLPFWENISKCVPDWKFIIAGDGPYLSSMEEEIKSKQIERVELVGRCQPDEYYEQASIFMMPSAFEGFPNTILEAQSFGCPVLAYDSYPSLSWIINHEEDALLSQPYDVSDMSNNAVKLCQNEDLLAGYQRNSLANAKRFLIDNVGQLWLNLFNEVSR